MLARGLASSLYLPVSNMWQFVACPANMGITFGQISPKGAGGDRDTNAMDKFYP